MENLFGWKTAGLFRLLLGLCFSLPLGAQPEADSLTVDTLSILSFNDFHGAFSEDAASPGAAALVQEILNEKRKYGNTIVVSVGDNFSGSYFSRITKGEPLPEVFRTMGVEMSAVGNHEFDWGPDYLKRLSETCLNPVSANITTDGVHTPGWLPPYRIVERGLKNGEKLRVAFVGLTTTETVSKTSVRNLEGLQFIHPLAGVVQALYNLKHEGRIDMVVLLMHIGTDQRSPSLICEQEAALLPYLDGIDAIVSGHSHEVVLGRVNNVPVVQAGCNGSHIGKLDFRIQACKGRLDISFIGGDTIRVTADNHPHIGQLVRKVMQDNDLARPLTWAENALVHDYTVAGNLYSYTPVGAYVTAAYADCFRKQAPKAYRKLPVVGVNHYGGLRTGIAAGEVTTLRAGNVLPFCGYLVAYRLTGRQLKKLLNDGRTNRAGYLQTSNVTLHVDGKGVVTKVYQAGAEITDRAGCVVVLDTYMASGGDGYDQTLFEGNAVAGFNQRRIETTAVFIDYLGSPECQPAISAEKAPLPRIISVK